MVLQAVSRERRDGWLMKPEKLHSLHRCLLIQPCQSLHSSYLQRSGLGAKIRSATPTERLLKRENVDSAPLRTPTVPPKLQTPLHPRRQQRLLGRLQSDPLPQPPLPRQPAQQLTRYPRRDPLPQPLFHRQLAQQLTDYPRRNPLPQPLLLQQLIDSPQNNYLPQPPRRRQPAPQLPDDPQRAPLCPAPLLLRIHRLPISLTSCQNLAASKHLPQLQLAQNLPV